MRQVLRGAQYRFRATFRRRWGGLLALVVLIGLMGGIAMGAVAAGRRTQSAFPRFLASTNPSLLAAGLVAGAVAALPGRSAARTPTALLLRTE